MTKTYKGSKTKDKKYEKTIHETKKASRRIPKQRNILITMCSSSKQVSHRSRKWGLGRQKRAFYCTDQVSQQVKVRHHASCLVDKVENGQSRIAINMAHMTIFHTFRGQNFGKNKLWIRGYTFTDLTQETIYRFGGYSPQKGLLPLDPQTRRNQRILSNFNTGNHAEKHETYNENMKDRKRGYANFLTATPRHTGARGNRCREYEGVENNAGAT